MESYFSMNIFLGNLLKLGFQVSTFLSVERIHFSVDDVTEISLIMKLDFSLPSELSSMDLSMN